jgi:putative transposase
MGSPRILGELRKLGIPGAKSTMEKYHVRPRRPASPSWRAFLKNHITELAVLDFFTVPIPEFKALFVLIVVAHDRRRILHCNGTAHPTAPGTAQQPVEAFPWDPVPRHLLRDRDALYGHVFQRFVAGLGMEQVLTAPRSPWQNAYAERVRSSSQRAGRNQVRA